jgi:hypothetical protein
MELNKHFVDAKERPRTVNQVHSSIELVNKESNGSQSVSPVSAIWIVKAQVLLDLLEALVAHGSPGKGNPVLLLPQFLCFPVTRFQCTGDKVDP